MRRVRVNFQHGTPPTRFAGYASVVSQFSITHQSQTFTFLEIRPDGWEKDRHILIHEGDILTPRAYWEKIRR